MTGHPVNTANGFFLKSQLKTNQIRIFFFCLAKKENKYSLFHSNACNISLTSVVNKSNTISFTKISFKTGPINIPSNFQQEKKYFLLHSNACAMSLTSVVNWLKPNSISFTMMSFKTDPLNILSNFHGTLVSVGFQFTRYYQDLNLSQYVT